MPGRDKPLFLARQGYRRRRIIDAARLLPIFGTVLFLVPILWDLAGPQEPGTEAAPQLAERGIYLFTVWAGLVISAAALSSRLRPVTGPELDRPAASDDLLTVSGSAAQPPGTD